MTNTEIVQEFIDELQGLANIEFGDIYTLCYVARQNIKAPTNLIEWNHLDDMLEVYKIRLPDMKTTIKGLHNYHLYHTMTINLYEDYLIWNYESPLVNPYTRLLPIFNTHMIYITDAFEIKLLKLNTYGL